jgi:GntR family transcriptional regulator/MocR family aminotransferase
MRDLYAERLGVLRESVHQHLHGAIELPPLEAGLHIPAHLQINARARDIEQQASEDGVETISLDRFCLKRKDLNAVLLGFAAFEARAIRRGVERLAAVIERTTS